MQRSNVSDLIGKIPASSGTVLVARCRASARKAWPPYPDRASTFLTVLPIAVPLLLYRILLGTNAKSANYRLSFIFQCKRFSDDIWG